MGDYTKGLKKRVLIQGSKNGYCVICGDYGSLSVDHVPQKSCNNLNDVEIRTLHDSNKYSKIGTTSQGGTHYRTLCKRCNNTYLGTHYDPYLADLSNQITSLALGAKHKNIVLPRKIYPFIRPQRIARAIIGHTLAAIAVNETKTGPIKSVFNDTLRHYFLDQSEKLPNEIEIYYWPYPSRQQVVVKNFGKTYIRFHENIVGHLIKFLPLGFWIVWEKPKSLNLNLYNLVPDKNIGIDEINQVEIDLFNIPPLNYPEIPEDDEFIVLNNNYAVTTSEK